MTAFDLCSGGYDLFDDSEWSLLSQGKYPEALDRSMAETLSGPAQVCQLRKARVTYPKDRGGSYCRPNDMDSHKNIPGGGVRIWKSIILPSVKGDT